MGLFKLALAGATGYALYRMYRGSNHAEQSAADGEATAGFAPVRNSGQEAMASDMPPMGKH